MSDQYYTLEEVMKKLGKSRSTVIRDTNAGKIPSEGEKKNRHYPREAIDAIAEIQQKKKGKSYLDLSFHLQLLTTHGQK